MDNLFGNIRQCLETIEQRQLLETDLYEKRVSELQEQVGQLKIDLQTSSEKCTRLEKELQMAKQQIAILQDDDKPSTSWFQRLRGK